MERGLDAATRVRLKATELCHLGDRNCFPFHAIRPYLRLFDMVGGPGRNEAFFLNALSSAAHNMATPPRILIAGTADDSIYTIARQAVPHGEITVLDQCELPLYLCRRVAKDASNSIETVASDIFDYAPEGDMDVICCDAFFCQIPVSRHGALVDKWRRVLRHHGQVITTTRIDPASPDDGLVRTRAQVVAFRDRVLDKARPWLQYLDLSLDEIADLAERHAGLIQLHNVRSKEELIQLFEGAGFRLDHLTLTERSRSGRAMTDRDLSAYYAEIIATRI
jgi:SAM-dependent methyltransferase